MAADLLLRERRSAVRIAVGLALWLLHAAASIHAQSAVSSDYKIGRNDVLLVATIGRPEASGQFTVDDTGAITFPLLGRVEVAGLPSASVAARLREGLANGFFNDPQVSVRVAEFKSQRVLVMGEVRNPGSYPLTGQTTVLGILAQAGSTTAEAGGEIVIRRNEQVPVPKSADGGEPVVHLDLTRLETGRIPDTIILRDGDTVFVPRSEQVFVFGEVRSPGAYRLRRDMTVLQALALAGGVTEGAATNRVRVERVEAGKRKTVRVKLTDLVRPGDTVVVPERFF